MSKIVLDKQGKIKNLTIDLSKDFNWNSFIANIWKKLFSKYDLDKQGSVIEIAPGSINKIGLGLSRYEFNGELHVIEPNIKSMKSIIRQYKRMLKSEIKPVTATLLEAIPSLPRKVHAIISNHPLDDMIIGKLLNKKEFDNFFNDNYKNVPAKRLLWEKIDSDKNKLKKAKQEVINEWCKLIYHTNPDIVIISQYESYFFKSNNITAPDKHAFDVLQALRARYSQFSKDIQPEQFVKDSNRWLILRKPTQITNKI